MRNLVIILIISIFGCAINKGEIKLLNTPLEKAILNWQINGGDLYDHLKDLNDYKIIKRQDAEIIVKTLKAFSLDKEEKIKKGFFSPIYKLASYFQQVESQKAYDELKLNGIPELIRLFEEGKNSEDYQSDLEFVLKILAMYEDEAATNTVIEAAKASFAVDGYLWSIIFSQFEDKHIHKEKVIEAFRNNLPEGFIAVTYLDFVNSVAISQGIKQHPFNSTDGIEKLRNWITDTNPDNFSYAHSATASLPFINEKDRNPLLKQAINHPDINVQIEAAWASGKTGNPEGINYLVEKAKDVNFSNIACKYLKELGKESEIPKEVNTSDFQAMAEMCQWLAHPQEYGRAPDKIEQYDTRVIYWPPTDDKRQVWLFKYTYNPIEKDSKTEVGISMVGSVTFALFGEATENLKAEEVYGLHCCWELEYQKDKRTPEKRTAEAGIKILAKYNNGF